MSAFKISSKDSYVYDHMFMHSWFFFFFLNRKVLFPERHEGGKQTENKYGACPV